MGQFAKQYADSIGQTTGHIVAIADRDQFIAVAGMKKDWVTKPISKDLETLINDRESIAAGRDEKGFIKVSQDEDDISYEVIAPIISEGDAIGAVLILSKDPKTKLGEVEIKVASTAAAFMGRQMEN